MQIGYISCIIPQKIKVVKRFLLIYLSFLGITLPVLAAENLNSGFINPPDSAKPRTWWHWINGNISKEGITADLEAMKRVGIQEAQIFNVDMGYPDGPAAFLSPVWLELFRFAASEADRLGLELGFHNGAGWSSSGGPWVTPENAMQTVVYSEVQCSGGEKFNARLPQPPTRFDYYKDIAVVAFPKPRGDQRIDYLDLKSLSGHSFRNHMLPEVKDIDRSSLIDKSSIIDLRYKMSSDGTLEWNVPAGDWIILRLGHTPTGKGNHPAVAAGRGLECDKMSRAAVDAYWQGGIKPIMDKLGPLVGSSLTNCLIDSYEVGCNNWTTGFDKLFEQSRGYDCLFFLPALAGYYVESGEITERFLWDFRRVIGDLMAENYYGRFRELCHQHGMKFSVEPYNGPFECLQAGAAGDIVMGEFWLADNVFLDSPKFVSSIAHLSGNTIVGAESFTCFVSWLNHPATMKSLGDRVWTEGVNRLIFHSYVHQPWNAAPGLTLGPFGLEMNRLNTWWEQGSAYMKYAARSQFMLQQGRNSADVLVFTGESSPNDALLMPELKALGYDYDLIGTDKIQSLFVRDGKICTPAGGIYQILMLPENTWITPGMLTKIGELAKAGAVITGSKPEKSPSLSGFPGCDDKVAQWAGELWDGKLIKDISIQEALNNVGLAPDFAAGETGFDLRFIHRIAGDADIYFVASSLKDSRREICCFRVSGKQPQLWNPQTGEITDAPVWQENEDGTTSVPIAFDPEGSVFVVFRNHASSSGHIVEAETELDPQEIKPLPELEIIKAEYGVFFPVGLADVTDVLNDLIKNDTLRTSAGTHLSSYDPAPGSIKELRVEYEIAGERRYVSAPENEPLIIGAIRGSRLKIIKAVYGKFERGFEGIPPHSTIHNVTGRIESMVASGEYVFAADDRLIGDILGSHVQSPKKELRLVYSTAGETRRMTVVEGHRVDLAISTPDPRLIIENGKPIWITPYAGTLVSTTSSGEKKTVRVKSVPEPIELSGQWYVSFPPDLGAPASSVFDKLTSWSVSSEEGIRYFSGTATYRKQFILPEELTDKGYSLELDLGDVRVIAEVIVNGQNLGVIWKAPFRADLDNAVREGVNELEVRITNLWPNRLIGDEHIEEDVNIYKGWPEWLVNNEKSPGRIAFTTCKNWDKDSPLQLSGLLGPVIIRPYVRAK